MYIWRNSLIVLFSFFVLIGLGQEDAKAKKRQQKGEFSALVRVGVVSSQILGDNFGDFLVVFHHIPYILQFLL